MNKHILIIFLFVLIHGCVIAQSVQMRDSLIQVLTASRQDTNQVNTLNQLGNYFKFNHPDSSIFYSNKALSLARKISFPEGEVFAMRMMAIAHKELGNYTNTLQISLKVNQLAEKYNLMSDRAYSLNIIGTIYNASNDHDQAIAFYKESKALLDSIGDFRFSTIVQSNIGYAYRRLNQMDSAWFYANMAYENSIKLNDQWFTSFYPTINMGRIKFQVGKHQEALKFFMQALPIANNLDQKYIANKELAKYYHSLGFRDSSIYYAKNASDYAHQGGFLTNLIGANKLSSTIYDGWNTEEALRYNKLALTYQDSLQTIRNSTALTSLFEFDDLERQHELEKTKAAYNTKVQRLWIFSILGALISAIVIVLVLYRNNKNKQKANAALKDQKEEIQSTLEKLKSTQSQLIQSEKMASLGELTAGIAHEIQNPLNFVNNFSEVNKELIEELKAERIKVKEERDEKMEEEILNDIEENESKIKHHGQRAEAIVKGMLQHSRTSLGEKEPTDINALADEYLRLAYHGLRAKDKNFNAEFKTELDPKLPRINVVPQDMGRVLLNLINNAFYAVDKKAKEGIKGYQPLVEISTKNHSKSIEISIKDNGPGIPEQIKDKIFQPFFTTKPTGSGTGLGLSLSYDIITQGHDGHLEVESEEGIGSRFIIEIPITA